MTHPRRIAALAILAALFLAAGAAAPARAAGYWTCRSGEWVGVDDPQHPKPLHACGSKLARPRTRDACLEAGGRWGRGGLSPRPICTLPTRDAGRVCGDSGECDGLCVATLTPDQRRLIGRQPIATTGRCTAHTPVYGCLAIVTKGHVRGILCRD